jgi:hypothetical protein
MIKFSDFNRLLRKHLPGIGLPRHSCSYADSINILRTVIVRAGKNQGMLISCKYGEKGCSLTTSETEGKVNLDCLAKAIVDFCGMVPHGETIRVTVRDTMYNEASTVIPRESL